MQLSIRAICKLRIHAESDVVGRVNDVLIDERKWAVRYLVLETGSWLADHKVLISPVHLITEHWDVSDNVLPTSLSKDQIERGPLLKRDAPVSQRYEAEYAKYYGDLYGTNEGNEEMPVSGAAESYESNGDGEKEQPEKRCVRSWMELLRYEVRDRNGVKVGKADDFLVVLSDWLLTNIAIDVGSILNKRCVFVAVSDIDDVNWEHHTIRLGISRQHCENAQEITSAELQRDHGNKTTKGAVNREE